MMLEQASTSAGGQKRNDDDPISLLHLFASQGNRFRQGITISALPVVANRSSLSKISAAAGGEVRWVRGRNSLAVRQIRRNLRHGTKKALAAGWATRANCYRSTKRRELSELQFVNRPIKRCPAGLNVQAGSPVAGRRCIVQCQHEQPTQMQILASSPCGAPGSFAGHSRPRFFKSKEKEENKQS
jgi:hypothetical protein